MEDINLSLEIFKEQFNSPKEKCCKEKIINHIKKIKIKKYEKNYLIFAIEKKSDLATIKILLNLEPNLTKKKKMRYVLYFLLYQKIQMKI